MTTNPLDRWLGHAASSAKQQGARHGIRLENPQALVKWLYILAVILAGAWTLFMWGVYALLGLSDEALGAGSRFFTIDAQILEWLAGFVGGAQQLGGALVLIVWGVGLALLILGGWLGRRLVRAFGKASSSRGTHAI